MGENNYPISSTCCCYVRPGLSTDIQPSLTTFSSTTAAPGTVVTAGKRTAEQTSSGWVLLASQLMTGQGYQSLASPTFPFLLCLPGLIDCVFLTLSQRGPAFTSLFCMSIGRRKQGLIYVQIKYRKFLKQFVKNLRKFGYMRGRWEPKVRIFFFLEILIAFIRIWEMQVKN